jgi:hypothetical protein
MLATKQSARTAMTRVAVVALGVGSLLVAGIGVGAAIGTSKSNPIWANGTIHQCLNKKTWVTRTLPRGKKCTSKETAYSFNQTGPRGLKGAAGKAGLGASVSSDDNAVAPATDGTLSVIKQVKITTSAPGKLLILNAMVEAATINNTTPTTLHYTAAVYVDGRGVPDAVSLSPGAVPAEATYAVAPFSIGPGAISVGAGTHTVAIKIRTTDTTGNYLTSASGRLLVVATG